MASIHIYDYNIPQRLLNCTISCSKMNHHENNCAGKVHFLRSCLIVTIVIVDGSHHRSIEATLVAIRTF